MVTFDHEIDLYTFLRTLPRPVNPYRQSDRAIWRQIQFNGEHNYPLAMEQAKQYGERLASEDMSNE